MQGAQESQIEALCRGDVAAAGLDLAERKLLEFVARLTRESYRITATDAEELRTAGWQDPQIAEAVYVTAMFAWFNRVADAFGLEDPGYLADAARGKTPPPPAEKGLA